MNTSPNASLNQGQEAAANAAFRFLFSDDKEFSISGPAGTGKTHLMRHIASTTLPEYEASCKLLGKTPIDYEIVLTATTNKAAEVLALSTGLPTSTIHSHMNLRVVDDYSTGVSRITRGRNWTVHTRQIIFIDEASMIDSKLYNHLIQGTDNTCKIVYLGDHCQLAPVFETISPVYRNPKHTALLTEPMRNADQPALVDLCNQLRHTVDTGEFKPILPVPGVIDYLDPVTAESLIKTTFKEEEVDARILAYSNDRVRGYLEYIRNLRGYPNIFTVGEHLLNNSGVEIGKRILRVEQEFVVQEIVQKPFMSFVDPNDSNSGIETYRIKIVAPTGEDPFIVNVAVYRDRLKSLMKHYVKTKNWTMFYKLKNNYPDLRQKDAATVYKAQGSTYGTTFLDLNNIGQCTDNDQLARMLYVGASRARSRLVLFGQLPDRLFK